MKVSSNYQSFLLLLLGIFFLVSCGTKHGFNPGLITEKKDVEKLVEDWVSIVNDQTSLADLKNVYHTSFTSFRGKKLGDYHRNKINKLYDAISNVKSKFEDEIFVNKVVYGDDYSEVVIYFILKRKNIITNDIRYSEWIGYLELNAKKIRRELLLMGPTDDPDEPPFGGGGEY
jgi:hypothetical protein